MAYDNKNAGNYQNRNSTQKSDKPKIPYLRLTDDNYVDMAEKVILTFDERSIVTTTQLRNLLAMISDIYNDILDDDSVIKDGKNDTLIEEITSRINYLKLKFIYESGRDEKVKFLIKEASILEHLKDIQKSRKNFILFSRYMEALVAYRKYYFGNK